MKRIHVITITETLSALTKNLTQSMWPYIVQLLYKQNLIVCLNDWNAKKKKSVWPMVSNEQTEG